MPPLQPPLQFGRNFERGVEITPMSDPPQHNPQPAGQSESSLELRLLGAFSLRIHGQEVSGLFRPTKWLLALLVLHRSAPLAREWLAETLWPETTQERSAFYLRRSLTQMRTALGLQRHRLVSPTRATLRFDLSDVFCDVIAFDRLVEAGEEASLAAAVALYAGVLLEECDADWVLPNRAHLRERYTAALETLAARREEDGNLAGAMQALRRVMDAEPLRETAHRRLMKALGQTGDYISVERQYRELRRALRDELNIEPAQETVELYRNLMQEQRQPASHSALPRRSVLADTVRFDNIPRPLGELIGREKEQTEITALLRNERLVTLTGTGGVGKTRLALAVAGTQQPEFTHGVAWIELAALSSAAQVIQAILVALHLSERKGETTLQTLTSYLRAKRLLLVLDNCEHLLDTCAKLMRELLDACADLHILTTSRQALRLFGECVWHVPSLAVPGLESPAAPNQGLLLCVEEADAARLFITRARSVRGDFRLTQANAGSIAQICRKLEGIPLALELAAVWVRSLSLRQIALLLDDPLALLQRGDPTADPRHQTLRATMDWSYGLLTSNERTLLSRLTIFAGGWTLDAVSAICFENDTGRQALPLLESLIQKSLAECGERNGEAWYRLLEPVRQYARERLAEAQEEQALRRRHRDYFLAFAERLTPLLEGAQAMKMTDRIEADYDNLHAALRFSLDEKVADVADNALRLATALSQFQWRRGYYQEGWEGLEAALQRSSLPEDAALRGEAMLSAGTIGLRAGDLHAGKRYGEATEAFYRRLLPSSGLVRSLRLLGLSVMWTGNYPEANAILEEGIALAQQIEDRDNEARLQMALGISARLQGDLARAQAVLEKAVRHCQAAALLADEAVGRHNLAVSFVAAGAHREAKPHFLRSLEIHRRLRNHSWVGVNLFDLSRIALLEGNLAEARVLCEEALALCRAGDRNIVPLCLQILAGVERLAGNLSKTRACLEEALTLMQQMEVRHDTIGILIEICYLLRDEGRYLPGARLLAAIMTFKEKDKTWLPALYITRVEELGQDFRQGLGEEALAEAQNTTDTSMLDEILTAAFKRGD